MCCASVGLLAHARMSFFHGLSVIPERSACPSLASRISIEQRHRQRHTAFTLLRVSPLRLEQPLPTGAQPCCRCHLCRRCRVGCNTTNCMATTQHSASVGGAKGRHVHQRRPAACRYPPAAHVCVATGNRCCHATMTNPASSMHTPYEPSEGASSSSAVSASSSADFASAPRAPPRRRLALLACAFPRTPNSRQTGDASLMALPGSSCQSRTSNTYRS